MSGSSLPLAPEPSSFVRDTPEETAYRVFKAYLDKDEKALSQFFGEYATNTCKQDYGSLLGCIDAIYTSRGLQNLQEWDV